MDENPYQSPREEQEERKEPPFPLDWLGLRDALLLVAIGVGGAALVAIALRTVAVYLLGRPL